MPKVPVIYPAILAKSAKDFCRKIKLAADYFDMVQIDVMDGFFVAEKTNFSVKAVASFIPKKLFIEVHLMVCDPLSYMLRWSEVASRYIIHLEAVHDIIPIILLARGLHKELILAINPSTKLSRLLPYLDLVDGALLMTVDPGKSGQIFKLQVLSKIKQLRKERPKIMIMVDGGINEKTIRLAYQAGASRFVVGSAFWKKNDFLKTKKELLKACYV